MLSFLSVLSVIFLVVSRFIFHPWNFSPAMAFFLHAGRGPRGRVLPIFLALLLTDVALGFGPSLLFGYAAYLLAALWMKRRRSHWLPATASASVLFFMLSNFGVWATTAMYAHTGSGLLQCYWMAVPFFGNTLLGNLFYSFVMFEVVDRLSAGASRLRSVA